MKKEKVRFAVVGLNFGRHILEELKSEERYFSVAAVCDLNADKAREEATKLGVAAYNDLDALLQNPEIDAVGLYTGPSGRANLIRKIVRAGKHVMTTKPFELNPDKAFDVLEEAARLGKVVHLNSPSPLPAEDLRIITGWRDRFNLGRPIACRAETWANYREPADGNWYDDPLLCPAAPIYRLGIYLINDLIHLLGEPEHVNLLQSRLLTGRPTADNAQMGILFKNGVIANVFSSFCVGDGQHYRNTLTLNYENGTIYRNVGPLRGDEPHRLSVIAQRGDILETAKTRDQSGHYQWEAFYQAVRGEEIAGEDPVWYRKRIVAGIQVIEAMKHAQETGGMATVEGKLL